MKWPKNADGQLLKLKNKAYLLLFCLLISVSGWAADWTPVLYKGRVRPVSAVPEDTELLLLPGSPSWHPVRALQSTVNITAYNDETYAQLQKDPSPANLQNAYLEIAGTRWGKSFHYPTVLQLKAEALYHSYPWGICIIALYTLAFVSALWEKKGLTYLLFGFAFCLHTALLALRIYILGRPPSPTCLRP